MDWKQPCQCEAEGWCPRYREHRSPNRVRLCQTRVDYREHWGALFEAGRLGRCRHGRFNDACTLCQGIHTVGLYDRDEINAINAVYQVGGNEIAMLHYTGRGLPYGQYLWAAGLTLADFLMRHPLDPALSVLDLGCGSGIVGIAALASGSKDVTFADANPGALDLAEWNAQRNGFSSFSVQADPLIDWRLAEPAPPRQWDAVLLSDVLDDDDDREEAAADLVRWIRSAWTGRGPCILADPARRGSAYLRNALAAAGVPASIEEVAFASWSTWLWWIGEAARSGCAAPSDVSMPAIPEMVETTTCSHRAERYHRLQLCPSCGGTVKLKVFACEVYGECTLQKPLEGLQCCGGCPDYLPEIVEAV